MMDPSCKLEVLLLWMRQEAKPGWSQRVKTKLIMDIIILEDQTILIIILHEK